MLIPVLGTRYTDDLPSYIIDLKNNNYINLNKFIELDCIGRESINIGKRMIGCRQKTILSAEREIDLVECSHCDNNYIEEEFALCCNTYFEITSINYSKVFEDTLKIIQSTGCKLLSIDNRTGNYLLQVENRQYLLVLEGEATDFLSISKAIQEKDGLIFIKLVENKLPTLPDTIVTISAIDIITSGFEKEKFRLRDLPSAQTVIESIQKISLIEEEILNKSSFITWQAVENELTNFFLDKLRSQQVQLYKYRTMLDSYPRFRRIPVNAAGAGNADKLTIDLLDYLEEVIKGDFTADAKCYTTTAVDHHTIEKVQHHLSKDKFNSKRILILATTNKVTCWDDVHDYKITTGQYRLLIFSARIIAEVVVHLDFADEFLSLLQSCVSAGNQIKITKKKGTKTP
ncbi:hypothetical protein HUB98_16785 [Paenibacillus barcinonensis]|uniref:Uncharacterized protein n=1 Tax=Paenibacillus barcinonensis TaxID=198119 RepID=A0A2V4W2R2_PAEBA|nr:hypothetical protein [Paenibacillus barcinonensis]PYE48780.1 hypothetical protein DFQ00_10773 [Paenibacillus barcinonensis]QKS57792.1 hypothetical protein HUB98_16785 [Paenibacillus barcinonensis]